jgi:hypothetical protein
MYFQNVLNDGNRETSIEILSATKARLLSTRRNSRITESNTFILSKKGWINTRDQAYAGGVETHLLSYCLAKWSEAGGEDGERSRYDLLKIINQRTDLEDERQTNSFQGRAWR